MAQRTFTALRATSERCAGVIFTMRSAAIAAPAVSFFFAIPKQYTKDSTRVKRNLLTFQR